MKTQRSKQNPNSMDKHRLRRLCPVCKVTFALSEYPEHMRREHPEVPVEKHVDYPRPMGIIKSAAEVKSLLEYQKTDSHKYEVCPICKASVKSEELEFHTRAAHPTPLADSDGVRLGRNGLGPLRPIQPSVFVCPVCKIRLKSAAKLEKHSVIHAKRRSSKYNDH